MIYDEWKLKKVDVPQGARPCYYCKSMDELYAESPVNGDWHGRGHVIRIGCLCDDGLADDDYRTEFDIPKEALAEWNEMLPLDEN